MEGNQKRHKENNQEVTLINGLGEWRKGRPAVPGRVWDTTGQVRLSLELVYI